MKKMCEMKIRGVCLFLALAFFAGVLPGVTFASGEAAVQETAEPSAVPAVLETETTPETQVLEAETVPETQAPESSAVPAPEVETALESGSPATQEAENTSVQVRSLGVYTLWGEDGAIVYDYADLNNALSNANGINKIYFGADITMQSGGIRIHANKTDVEISGLNPQNPGQETPYTLTDYASSSSTSSTIWVTSSSTALSLKVSDLTIVGKNYYGPFSVANSSATVGVTVTYERVAYSGPQFVYHRYGTMRIVDCDVTITGQNQEFGEVRHLAFAGDNTIVTGTSTSSAVFWYVNGGTFKIEDNASLALTAANYGTSSVRGIFYSGSSASYSIDLTIGQNAVFDVETTAALTQGDTTQANFSAFTVEAGGMVSLQTQTVRSPVIYMRGDITVGEGAAFTVNSTGSGNSSGSIISHATGNTVVGQGAVFHLVAAGTYQALLDMGSYALNCTDPESVLLYNPGGRVIQGAGLSVNAQQVNYWTSAGSGGIDDVPARRWINAVGNVAITATVTSAGTTTVASHTYDGISGEAAPNSNTFSMAAARTLSFGRLEISVDALNEMSENITGVTAAGAAVRASYKREGSGGSGVLADTLANSASGAYAVSLNGVLFDRDTVFTVKSALRYLFAEASATGRAARTVAVEHRGLDGSQLTDSETYFVTDGEAFTAAVSDGLTDYQFSRWELDGVEQSGDVLKIGSVTGDHKITLIYAEIFTITHYSIDMETGDRLGELTEISLLEGGSCIAEPSGIEEYECVGVIVDGGDRDVTRAYCEILTASRDHTIVFVFHPSSTLIQVTVPSKLLWAAFVTDGGHITAPDYTIMNNSALPVDVTLSVFKAVNPDGITLVSDAPGSGEYTLSMVGTSPFGSVNLADSASLNASIGRLGITEEDQVGAFTFSGLYAGSFNVRRQPVFSAVFRFSAVLPETLP